MTPPTTDWRARARALEINGNAFIDGRYVPAASGATFDCVSPIDGRILGSVASTDAADVDRAVAAARRAFDSGVWSRRAPRERKKVLLRFTQLIEQHAEELARLDLAAEELLDAVAIGGTPLPLPPEYSSRAATLATELRLHLLEGRRETWLFHAVAESEQLGRRVQAINDEYRVAGLDRELEDVAVRRAAHMQEPACRAAGDRLQRQGELSEQFDEACGTGGRRREQLRPLGQAGIDSVEPAG